MQIYKDRGSLAGFRLELPEPEGSHPISHIGEYLLAKDHLIPCHSHPTWELVLQVEGITSWSFGRQQLEVKEGELLICPPHLTHAKTCRERADYRIHFVGCRMEPSLWPALKTHLSVKRMIKLSGAKETSRYFRILEEELLLHQPLQKTGVELAWKQLWLAIYRLAESSPRMWNRENAWLTQRVRTLVESALGERWTLQAVARLMGYSANHFAERFQRESGQSFHQYLIAARIEAAQAALIRGEESITEIAMRLGFNSSQHISRVFAQRTGHPPSRWAKRSQRSRKC